MTIINYPAELTMTWAVPNSIQKADFRQYGTPTKKSPKHNS